MTERQIVPDKYDRHLFILLLSSGCIKEDGRFTKAWMKYLKRSGFVK